MVRFRSLRKVMLRTCIGADGGGPGAEYPNFAENKVRVAHNGHNGDLGGHVRDINHHPGWSVGEAVTSSELGEIVGTRNGDNDSDDQVKFSVNSCRRRSLGCPGIGRANTPLPGEMMTCFKDFDKNTNKQ